MNNPLKPDLTASRSITSPIRGDGYQYDLTPAERDVAFVIRCHLEANRRRQNERDNARSTP